MSTRVNVTIDRLVLGGMDPAARTAFVDGLRGELAEALANPATRAELQRRPSTAVLRLGPMPMGDGTSGARRLGQNVARAIGRGSGRSKGVRR